MNSATHEAAILIRKIYQIVERLEALFPGRHFTPDGHMVGSIGEVLAAARYGLELLPASAPLHDARTDDGKLVQIKATQSDRIAFRGTEAPSHLIVLALNKDGTVTEEYNGLGNLPWEVSGKPQSNGQRPVSLTRLRRIMTTSDPSQRIREAMSVDPASTIPNLSIPELEGILSDIVDRCATLVANRRRTDLLNERFFHHMFSWEVSRWYGERGMNAWDHLLIAPEFPTLQKFQFAKIDLSNKAATLLDAICGGGRSGNLDFVIRSAPRICVEWKGPEMWQTGEVTEVLLKLLTESATDIKVFAGILTSSTTGHPSHIEAAKGYFREAVDRVKRDLGIQSMGNVNLHAYLVTLTDAGPIRIHWGQVEQDSTQCGD